MVYEIKLIKLLRRKLCHHKYPKKHSLPSLFVEFIAQKIKPTLTILGL